MSTNTTGNTTDRPNDLEGVEEDPRGNPAPRIGGRVHEKGPVAEHDDVGHGGEGLVQGREGDHLVVERPPCGNHRRKESETKDQHIYFSARGQETTKTHQGRQAKRQTGA